VYQSSIIRITSIPSYTDKTKLWYFSISASVLKYVARQPITASEKNISKLGQIATLPYILQLWLGSSLVLHNTYLQP